MRMKWVIAVVGVVALAAVAVTTELPWLTKKQAAMVQSGDAKTAEGERAERSVQRPDTSDFHHAIDAAAAGHFHDFLIPLRCSGVIDPV